MQRIEVRGAQSKADTLDERYQLVTAQAEEDAACESMRKDSKD